MPAPWEYAKILQRAKTSAGPNATRDQVLALAAAEGYSPGFKISGGAKVALGAAAAVVAPALLPATNMLNNSLTPGTTPSPMGSGYSGAPRAFTGADTNQMCNLIPDIRLRAACLAATGLFGGGNNGSQPTFSGPAVQGCPAGYHAHPTKGCEIDGPASWLPGDIGRADIIWSPVSGRYGAAYTPILVQRNVHQCPAGHKLGKDGLCYDKLRQGDRLHNPGAKPFLTGGEVRTIRRAKALQKRFNRLRSGRAALFPTASRPAGGGKKRRRK